MRTLSRRNFLTQVGGVTAAAFVSHVLHSSQSTAAGQTTQINTKGFFTIAKSNGRWWLISPEGEQFFSIGLNHLDSATLRYRENSHIWRDKYGNSMAKWLEQVREDLRNWGFNTVGWVQEVVTRDVLNHRHSRNFTFEEYQWLDMPYCHMLPFVDFHQWEVETKNPDFYSKGFEQWCDYVARAHCGRLADDPKLIGYFYCDCPTWVHIRKDNTWKGPLFDPDKLKSQVGRKELTQLAGRYYKVTHDAIRRYDKNHLIFGDRYEAKAALPEEVVRAAIPYVDILSFQCFGRAEVVNEKLGYWGKLTDRPVLLADSSVSAKAHNPGDPNEHRHPDPDAYGEVMRVLRDMPQCVGYHLCGAYLANRVRGRGLRGEQDKIDVEAIDGFTRVNRETTRWMRE